MDTCLRKPSSLESFYIDLDTCGCNMTFHYFLQLDRRPSLRLLNRTLRKLLTTTHREINLKFRELAWHLSDYISPVRVEETKDDDVCNSRPPRLDFLKHTLALNVLHNRQDQWFLRFDFFHGAVDGRSGIQFIYDFFAALNGKDPRNGEFTRMDSDLVPVKQEQANKKLPIPCWPVHKLKSGLISGKGVDRTQLVRTMACTKSMAAKLSNAVASCFRERAKMIIPVDVRRYSQDKKPLFGNLIVPIFVDANTNRRIEDLRTEILSYVKDSSLLSAGLNSLSFYSRIKPSLRVAILRKLIPLVMASKKFICCALVSPVGEVKSDKLICPAFSVRDVIVSFVSFPFTAFTVASVQFDDHTNTTVSWHSGRVSPEVADNLIRSIDENLHT